MGSFYSNMTVLGASAEAVISALAGQEALVGPEQDGTVAVFPADEDSWPVLGQQLSGSLRVAVVGAYVHDDDILALSTWVDGQLLDEVSAPDPATVFGPEIAEMAEMAVDPGSPGHDPERLVGALGRGDVAAVREALAGTFVFASERHEAVAGALGLPASAAGWGYRYLKGDGEDYQGGELTEVS